MDKFKFWKNVGHYRPQIEVWGKVMFLHMSVILSTGEGVSVWCHFLPGPMLFLWESFLLKEILVHE